MPTSASRRIGRSPISTCRTLSPCDLMNRHTSETTRTASTSDRMKTNDGVRPPVVVRMLMPMLVISMTSDSCVG